MLWLGMCMKGMELKVCNYKFINGLDNLRSGIRIKNEKYLVFL